MVNHIWHNKTFKFRTSVVTRYLEAVATRKKDISADDPATLEYLKSLEPDERKTFSDMEASLERAATNRQVREEMAKLSENGKRRRWKERAKDDPELGTHTLYKTLKPLPSPEARLVHQPSRRAYQVYYIFKDDDTNEVEQKSSQWIQYNKTNTPQCMALYTAVKHFWDWHGEAGYADFERPGFAQIDAVLEKVELEDALATTGTLIPTLGQGYTLGHTQGYTQGVQ